MHGEHAGGTRVGDVEAGVDEDLLLLAAPALRDASSGVIDQDETHDLSGDGEEVIAALPVDAVLAYQPHKGFVDQGRRLERVARSFARHVTAGEPLQVIVDKREERIKGLAVAVAPGGEQRSDFGSRRKLLRHGGWYRGGDRITGDRSRLRLPHIQVAGLSGVPGTALTH